MTADSEQSISVYPSHVLSFLKKIEMQTTNHLKLTLLICFLWGMTFPEFLGRKRVISVIVRTPLHGHTSQHVLSYRPMWCLFILLLSDRQTPWRAHLFSSWDRKDCLEKGVVCLVMWSKVQPLQKKKGIQECKVWVERRGWWDEWPPTVLMRTITLKSGS